MRRVLPPTLAMLVLVATALPASAHELDHPVPPFEPPSNPPSAGINAGGEGATWELVDTIFTGNPHTDLDFFSQGGDMYAAVGTLAAGPNAGGQTIVQLTSGGELAPALVSAHPSASCVSDPNAALSLQHDVEATPKGGVLLNTENPHAVQTEAQLIIDATDAEGRCHDGGELGGLDDTAPQGGLEIVDVTDVAAPKELALTSHIGEAHTVNVDPKRPHIAYAVTSDSVGINADGRRTNELSGMALDGFEVVDLSSCLDLPADATLELKREACQPEVYRYRYPTADMALGHTNQASFYACHELEVYADDTLTCGSGAALVVLDMSGAFDDNSTPDDYTDDRPRGEPLPCRRRGSSTVAEIFRTAAFVTDCVVGGTEDEPVDLTVSGWRAIEEPSLEGVEHLGSVHHMGREATGETDPAFPSTEDIDFDHEAEWTHSGRYVLATDERGGGVAPPGAACAPGTDNTAGNGGIHAYRRDRLTTDFPATPEEAFEAYALNPEGGKAIHRVPVRTAPQASLCTAHVFQQIPGQNRIFMGWYSQGTQVLDYVEHPDGTFEWREAGWMVPEHANTWVSHVFKVDDNGDGTFTYYGATGDFSLGAAGRSAIDIYKVTLPAPPEPILPAQCFGAPVAPYADHADADPVHRPSLDCVHFREVAEGSRDAEGRRVYRPMEEVTRGQMASFVVNSLEAAGVTDRLPAGGGEPEFDDIEDDVHAENINRLARAGIVGGTGGGMYEPSAPVTRQQMATFMVKATAFAFDIDLIPQGSWFGDVSEDNVHDDNIDAGFEVGLFEGTTAPSVGQQDSGQFSPDRTVRRDQMASFLVNLLGVLEGPVSSLIGAPAAG